MPPLLAVGHLRQLLHTPAPAAEAIDERQNARRAGDLACSCVQLAHGGRLRVAGGDDQSRR